VGNQQNIRFGLVIAGGRSSRFGGEKAIAILAGRSLLDLACERLSADCTAVAVSAPSRGETAAEAARLGFESLDGLLWAQERGAERLITRPCDTPFLPDDLTVRLAAAGGPCAVARTPDGVQSLCAAWGVALIAPLREALGGGAHPAVHRFLEGQHCRFVDYSDASGFLNLNTLQDLAEAEQRVSSA
jgi:molybdenum cofactor guanylyltransferase